MSNPQHEPTMEEILASIRKIISEDATEAAPAAPAPPKLEAVAEPEDDVLELTDEAHDEPVLAAPAPPPPAPVFPAPVSPVPVSPAPAPAPDHHDDIMFQPAEEEPVMSAPAYPSEPRREPVYQDEPAARDHGIFSDRSRKAMDDVFAGIGPDEDEHHGAGAFAAPMPGIDGDTVAQVFEKSIRTSFEPVLRGWLGSNADELVERMKPVIREWLDHNFPPMLEEAVRNEVARVAKARPPRR